MAARYFINGGLNNNWGDTSNWSDTSGGAGGFSVPTVSDDVYLDIYSPNCFINASNRVCKTLDFTGYTNTISLTTYYVIVSGNVTFDIGMNYTCTNSFGISFGANGTLTTNGYVLQAVISFSAYTITLADDLYTNSTLRGGSFTINGNNVYLLDNSLFIVVVNNSICSGTTNIIVSGNNVNIGAGTTSLNVAISLNIDINTSGTITILAGTGGQFGFGNKTFKYTTGTVVWNATFIRLSVAGTVTFNMGSEPIPGLQPVVGSITISLTTDLYVEGTLTLAAAPIINNNTIYVYGITVTTNNNTTGTTTIVFNGTGTWNHTGTGYIRNNVTINTAGIVAFGSSIRYDTGTFTYTSGTVDTSTNSNNFNINASTIFNTNGMTFYNFLPFGGAANITLNSHLNVSNILQFANINSNWIGTSGFTCGTLYLATITAARSYSLLAGVTYTITSGFEATFSSNTVRQSIISGTPGTQTILTLSPGVLQNIGYVNATDINSGLGDTVFSFNAVLNNTTNWNTLTYPKQNNYTY